MIRRERWFQADRSSEIARLDREMQERPSPDTAYRLWVAWSRAHGVPPTREFESMKWSAPERPNDFPRSFVYTSSTFLYAIERNDPTDVASLALWSRVAHEMPDVSLPVLLQVAEREWAGFSWWKTIAVRHGTRTDSSYVDYHGNTIDRSRDGYGRLSAPGPEGNSANYGLEKFLSDLKGRNQRENTYGWTREEPALVQAYWNALRGPGTTSTPPPDAKAYSNIGSVDVPVYSTYWSAETKARAQSILRRVAGT